MSKLLNVNERYPVLSSENSRKLNSIASKRLIGSNCTQKTVNRTLKELSNGIRTNEISSILNELYLNYQNDFLLVCLDNETVEFHFRGKRRSNFPRIYFFFPFPKTLITHLIKRVANLLPVPPTRTEVQLRRQRGR